MTVSRIGDILVVKDRLRSGKYGFSYPNLKLISESVEILPEWVTQFLEDKKRPCEVDISDFSFKVPPWDHQVLGMKAWMERKRLLLFFEMGTGKTKISIDGLEYLNQHGLLRKALIVAPLSVLPTWAREWEKHSQSLKITYPKSTKALKEAVTNWQEGTVLLTNYEKLHPCLAELTVANPNCVIADELNKVKSARIQRTKALAKITAKADYALGLTGTPATNKLVDLFGEYLVIDQFWFGKYFGIFRGRYCVMGGWMGREIVGYKNESEIREILDYSSLTVRKKDVLDLPDKVFEQRIVGFEPFQKKVYKGIARDYLLELEEGIKVDIPSALARLTKLQEVCGGFVIGDGKTSKIGEAKIQAVLDILEELSTETPVVIWCRFIYEIEMLKNAIGLSRPVFELQGSMKPDARVNAEEGFRKASDKGAVWIIQIQTGGLGLQLEYVSHVIFYSNSFEALYRFQAEDRFHRPGQKNNVTYYDIILDKSVDEKILEALKEKKDLNEWVMSRNGRLEEILNQN